MDEVFNELAGLHQGAVTFIKVEAEAVPEVSERLEIAMVPSFVLMKGTVACGKLEGADPPTLAKRMQEFANERVRSDAPEAGRTDGISAELQTKLQKLTRAAPVMLFMKGSSQEPKCKFSRKMVEILRGAGVDFGSFDILADEEVRAGLKIYSKWSTFPQLYVKGALVGGVDEIAKLAEGGDLKSQLAARAGVDAAQSSPSAAAGGVNSLQERCKKLVASAETMLFMKGTPDAPRCGFSRSIVALLREEEIDFESFDILEDQDVRQCLKDLFDWPTFPQLYVRGELMGGLDIVKDMKSSGSLAPQLGVATKASREDRLKTLVSSNRVMLFMKGNPETPRCGFSRQAVALLREKEIEFGTFDILEDDEVRQGLKEFSIWPTYPQLYAGGELVGGLDIMKELAQSDELKDAVRPQS
ncbi:unnamed protein product [Ascophyllum nodosum]